MVTLEINNNKIQDFVSYQIDSNLFETADAFNITLANPQLKITAGSLCKIKINNKTELTGIIDKTRKTGDKNKTGLNLEGRGLIGLLIDSYCEDFFDQQNMTLKQLAEKLIAPIPYINRKIIFNNNLATQELTAVTIQPGKTVYEVLNYYAKATGCIIYAKPDQTIVFDQLKTSGAPLFSLIRSKNNPANNNILTGSEIDDISQQYKTCKVLAQEQGSDNLELGETNTEGAAQNPDFPFKKPLVLTEDAGFNNPAEQAKQELKKRQLQGYQLEYTTSLYSQKGNNYAINQIIHVQDQEFNINGYFLISARTFSLSKQAGEITTLKLSRLGREII